MLTKRLTPSTIILNVVIWLGALLVAYPFVWMIVSSLKMQSEIFGQPLSLIPHHLFFQNYVNLFKGWPFFRWYVNSVWIALVITGSTLLFSALGGYGFAKYHFKGRGWLFTIVLMSLSVPFQSILIPLFSEMGFMHLVNNYLSLIVPFIAPPIGIFLMRQFMYGVPDELLDAARMDGCGEFILFVRIVLPLLKPAMGALAIITFVGTWGNFLWPLIMLNNTAKFTLPLGLYALLSDASSGGTAQYGEMLAGSTLASLPPVILFLIMQRSFVMGITMGGVKDD